MQTIELFMQIAQNKANNTYFINSYSLCNRILFDLVWIP